jgi:hypothetical protein
LPICGKVKVMICPAKDGIGQGFLIPGHAGGKADFPNGWVLGVKAPKPFPHRYAAVCENKGGGRAIRAGLRHG